MLPVDLKGLELPGRYALHMPARLRINYWYAAFAAIPAARSQEVHAALYYPRLKCRAGGNGVVGLSLARFPPAPPKKKRKKQKSGRRVVEKRAYEAAPMNAAEAWLFHKWQAELVAAGKSVAWDGNRGYRETVPGSWKGELIAPNDIAQGEPGWVREELIKLAADWRAWVMLVRDWPGWFPLWLQALREDQRTAPDYAAIPDADWWEITEGRDPVELAQVVLMAQVQAGYTGDLPTAGTQDPAAGPGDYDPVRDGPRAGQAAVIAEDLPGLLPAEIQAAAGAPPLPGAPDGGPLVLRHDEPIRLQTRRWVYERGKDGRLTGKRHEVVVPTFRLDIESPLGQRVRLLDDDSGRLTPPRGALGYIESSRRHRQWLVPVFADGKYPGMKRDDPRHVQQRAELQADITQLVDHRTGKRREFHVLVTPRSKYFDLAMEFKTAFDGLQE